jgi:hypothetical protein
MDRTQHPNEGGDDSNKLPPHATGVTALLESVKGDRDAMLRLGMAVFGSPGAPMFSLDLLAFGAVKRNISTAHAFRMLVQSWNMVCARSLLRIHIDTGLRFSAAWLVEKPHDFATSVLRGERIDKLTDRDGKRLTDARLVDVRSSEYPWLPDVYENLCGYVHFSARHIHASVESVNTEDRTVGFAITEADLNFPESSWTEILECFREATAMLAKYLHGYVQTKNLSTDQLEEARRLWGDNP